MNIHEELWRAFNDISFEEEKHVYTDSKGTSYQSVTGWIHQFAPEVDWDEKLKSSAAKQNISPEELKKKWDYNGDYARNLGTQIHSVLENLFYKKDYKFDKRLLEKFPEMEEDFNDRKQKAKDLFRKLKRIYAPVANEFIVYDQENGICGTIDFLAYNMKTGKYAIIDWKTSKEFSTRSFTGDEFLKAPFDDVESCNTSEYSLQLSVYKYMLEKHTSIKIDELLLFQIPGKNKAVGDIHRCFDFSDRIAKFLEKK